MGNYKILRDGTQQKLGIKGNFIAKNTYIGLQFKELKKNKVAQS